MGKRVTEEIGTEGVETDLVTAVRAEDPAAMAALYERHTGQGLKFARSLMPGSEDAEDALQEAFANAVSAIRHGSVPVIAWAGI